MSKPVELFLPELLDPFLRVPSFETSHFQRSDLFVCVRVRSGVCDSEAVQRALLENKFVDGVYPFSFVFGSLKDEVKLCIILCVGGDRVGSAPVGGGEPQGRSERTQEAGPTDGSHALESPIRKTLENSRVVNVGRSMLQQLLPEAIGSSSPDQRLKRSKKARHQQQDDGVARNKLDGSLVHTPRPPLDWELKKKIRITSRNNLRWCQASPAAKSFAVLDHNLPKHNPQNPNILAHLWAVRMHTALLHWRHPSQRLPPALSKQLSGVDIGPSEVAYSNTICRQWQDSLRYLVFDLLEGRCPYFYCRHESFTLLWRNRAVSPAAEDGNHDNSSTAGEDSLWELLEGGKGEGSSFAILSPSTRGLRSQLRLAGVPFEMPRALAYIASTHLSPKSESDAIELEEVNLSDSYYASDDPRKHERESRMEKVESWLQETDSKPASLLLFRSGTALRALYDFLLNAKAGYHMSTQLLSPRPFLNGAPFEPLLRYIARVQSADKTDENNLECVEIEDSSGVGFLPSAVMQLSPILCEALDGEFELQAFPFPASTFSNGQGLNFPAPACKAPWPQPLARMPAILRESTEWPHRRERWLGEVVSEQGESVRLDCDPRTLKRLVCRGGSLFLDVD